MDFSRRRPVVQIDQMPWRRPAELSALVEQVVSEPVAREDRPGLVRRDEVSLLRRLQASLVELTAQRLHLRPLAALHRRL